jgi:fumarate reductase subunit C
LGQAKRRPNTIEVSLCHVGSSLPLDPTYELRERIMNVRLYVLQRATAAIMAPLVLAHIAIIFYATSRGLSAGEILGRTKGSIGWGLYYGMFVLAVSVHGAIGVRAVASEWTRLRGSGLDALMWIFGAILAALGLRAVAAVVL